MALQAGMLAASRPHPSPFLVHKAKHSASHDMFDIWLQPNVAHVNRNLAFIFLVEQTRRQTRHLESSSGYCKTRARRKIPGKITLAPVCAVDPSFASVPAKPK